MRTDEQNAVTELANGRAAEPEERMVRPADPSLVVPPPLPLPSLRAALRMLAIASRAAVTLIR